MRRVRYVVDKDGKKVRSRSRDLDEEKVRMEYSPSIRAKESEISKEARRKDRSILSRIYTGLIVLLQGRPPQAEQNAMYAII